MLQLHYKLINLNLSLVSQMFKPLRKLFYGVTKHAQAFNYDLPLIRQQSYKHIRGKKK